MIMELEWKGSSQDSHTEASQWRLVLVGICIHFVWIAETFTFLICPYMRKYSNVCQLMKILHPRSKNFVHGRNWALSLQCPKFLDRTCRLLIFILDDQVSSYQLYTFMYIVTTVLWWRPPHSSPNPLGNGQDLITLLKCNTRKASGSQNWNKP